MQINGTVQINVYSSTAYCNLVAHIVSVCGNSWVFHIVTERVQSMMFINDGYFSYPYRSGVCTGES